MKIIITGSLGHISKPLTEKLVQKGHSVFVISSNPEKQKAIEALGAEAAIGSLENVAFLTQVFTGADATYCMNPPNFGVADQIAYYQQMGACYAKAITQSGIKRVIYLSSVGAHLPAGTGIITGSHQAEKLLNAIPGIFLTHLRPGFFYYNLLRFIDMIKHAGFIGDVYGGEDRLALVSPLDIAAAIAEEITDLNSTKKIRYVSSDDRTCQEIASVLGKAIGKPDLKWLVLPEEQVLQTLLSHGVPQPTTEKLVELGLSLHSGALRADYDLNRPAFGEVSLEDFGHEFVKSFNH